MTGHTFNTDDVRWDGLQLRLSSDRLLATVEPDAQWAGLFRVRFPNGHTTDIVNLTRAKDAAVILALSDLNLKLGRAA